MLAALGYLEAHTAGSRRGRGGHERINVAGLVVAAFRHRSSRAGNPLLHTHVLVTNLGRALDDGKRRTLDSRRIYAHTKTAGYVYQAQLRHELSCRLGAEWTPSRTGTADLVGIGESVIRDFSHRRIEAEAAMAARGETSARAAQASTLETRRAKDNGATAETLRSAWRERATELGLIASAVERVTGPVHSRDATDHQCGVGSLGCSARAGSPSTKRLVHRRRRPRLVRGAAHRAGGAARRAHRRAAQMQARSATDKSRCGTAHAFSSSGAAGDSRP